MNPTAPEPAPPAVRRPLNPYFCAALIALAILGAYANCFRAPFVYDDQKAIPENPSIRHLWPLWEVLASPPADGTVGGRPVANLTLAINYAASGTGVWSYHALNVLIHILAALLLFGLVRRTLAGPVLRGRFGRDADALALAVAVIWALHPLQTESVTYVVQRVESLMGLFYLLTLYCFVRSTEAPRPIGWQVGAALSCLLGMATKEAMVTAPLLVLLYDRTFVAGTFREALRRRRGLYGALVATWVPLLGLVASTGWNRGRSAGFNAGVSPGVYWLTQLEAVAKYGFLSVWPRPLVFDYGPFRRFGLGEVAPYAVVVALMVVATLAGLWRRSPLGFLGAWFLVILAPSSVVPVASQTMAEHRMYLSLAAVACAGVVGIYSLLGRWSWPLLAAAALLLGILTARRNEIYSSELRLWTDTVAKRPENANARNNLGLALFRAGQAAEAVQQYEAALGLEPRFPGVMNNLGNALDQSGRTADAIRAYEGALRLEPAFAAAHFNLGKAYERAGRVPEAIEQFEAAAKAEPDNARAYLALGNALIQSGQAEAAIGDYEQALRIQPDLAEASNNLGIVLCRSGRLEDGIKRIDAAIRAQPDFAPAYFSRGIAMMQTGRRDEAIAAFGKVLELRPNDPAARRMLEMIRSSP
jgi:tetratricopeptide (TPR) repeat protein